MKSLKTAGLILATLVCCYLLVFGAFYLAGYRIYRIPTEGMKPTIQKGERVIGRLSESYKDRIQRFDLAIISVPTSPGQLFLKRVVGLSGERIAISERGIRINGRELILPNSIDREGLYKKSCDMQIPDDDLFVLGDYTLDSYDSRYYGPISKNGVKGYLVFRK